MMRQNGLRICASLAVLCAASPAIGQLPERSQQEDIIVTALRHDMTALSAPVAISAVSGEMLDLANVRAIEDLQHLVPGLSSVRSGQSNTRLIVRGLQGVGEPLVGLYYDEMPMSGIVGASNDAGGSTPLLSLIDVDRAEVLRGPQGALYGAGAMTGAVRILWNKPDDTLSAAASGGLQVAEGGGIGVRGDAVLNLPVSEILSMRFVAYGESQPSFVHNDFLGQDVAGTEILGGRASVRLAPASDLTIDLVGTYQKAEGDVPYWDLNSARFNAFNQARLLNRDEIWTVALSGTYQGPGFDVTASASHIDRKVEQGLNDVSEFFLGNVNNATACARVRGGGSPCSPAVQDDFNAYVLSFVPSLIYPIQDATIDAAELRFSSSSGSVFRWTFGAFFSERNGALDNTGLRADAGTGDLDIPFSYTFRRNVDEQLQQLAGYGEVTLSPVSALDFTLGARAFRYERVVGGGTTQGLDLINAAVLPFQSVKTSEDGVVIKGNITWHISPRTLVYVEASQGYRPGGANQVVNLPAELVPYESDSLWNYELGFKSALLDDRVEIFANLFRMDWSRIQVSGSRPDGLFRFIDNAGKARTEGAEFELRARPLAGFDLGGSLSLLNARLTEDQRTTLVVAPGLDGDRIPYSRKVLANADVGYSHRRGDGKRIELRAEAHYAGPAYSEFRPNNVFYRRLAPYTLANIRIGIESANARWSVALRVDNLFDATAIQSISASGLTAGRTLGISLPPRTWSIQGKISY